MFASLVSRHHSALFRNFVHRELNAKLAGSALGASWTLLSPLLLLAIYALVFGQILQPRSHDLGTDSYLLFVAVALWPWLMFADGLTRGMVAVQNNGSLVKKVAFPHILLVGAAVTGAFIQHLLAYSAIVMLLHLSGLSVQITGLPVVIFQLILLYFLTLGAASLLAALQTVLRDVEQVVSPLLMLLHYLTPVLYPVTLIPVQYRSWFDWNPIATIVTRIRESLLAGPALQAVDAGTLACAAGALLIGGAIFSRLSPFFEDFL